MWYPAKRVMMKRCVGLAAALVMLAAIVPCCWVNVMLEVIRERVAPYLPVSMLNSLVGFVALLLGLGLLGAAFEMPRRMWAELERDQARDGFCFGCGYDLKGNPAAERCPECGRGVVVRR